MNVSLRHIVQQDTFIAPNLSSFQPKSTHLHQQTVRERSQRPGVTQKIDCCAIHRDDTLSYSVHLKMG